MVGMRPQGLGRFTKLSAQHFTVMATQSKIPTSVYAEMTPNPATMKFVADRLLISGGQQVEFTAPEQTTGFSPLAEELFHFPFVTGVFISGNFVTLTKDESISWDLIVQQIRVHVLEWLMENEVAVTAVPEALTGAHDPSEVESPISVKTSATDYSQFLPTEFDEQISFLLDEFVRPAVEQDGGAIDFKAFHEGKVYVQLKGACSGCPSSMQTLKGGIETLLKANMEQVEEVVAEEA